MVPGAHCAPALNHSRPKILHQVFSASNLPVYKKYPIKETFFFSDRKRMPNPKLGDLTGQMTRFLQQMNNRVGESESRAQIFKDRKGTPNKNTLCG